MNTSVYVLNILFIWYLNQYSKTFNYSTVRASYKLCNWLSVSLDSPNIYYLLILYKVLLNLSLPFIRIKCSIVIMERTLLQVAVNNAEPKCDIGHI